MKTYAPHPAAKQIPLMKPAELRKLASSIIQRGQVHPIVLLDGMVLDGRNRLEACRMAGIEPKTIEWIGAGGTPTTFIETTNLDRRNLSKGQIAMAISRLVPFYKREAREAQRAGGVSPQGRKAPRQQLQEAASKLGVSMPADRTMDRATAVAAADPDLAEKVFTGDVTLKQAERSLRRAEQVKQASAYVPPSGEYPVVVIDPPWPYEDQLDGGDGARGGTPYPSMDIEEIIELDLPLAKDAAVFLWVTNSHLVNPDAYASVAAAWRQKHGLEPKGVATWEKDRLGLGRYFRNKTEHLILFVRGKPTFTEEKPWSHFRAPAGRHSEKPEAAYLAIEKFCASTSRLEMFARAPRNGWTTSGSELGSELTRS